MLHPDVLILLRGLASVIKGPIVEFGTYIGGSTAMIAKGVGDNGKFLAVEPGGTYPTHPHLPSMDIFADLLETLREQDVLHRVNLLNDNSRSVPALDAIDTFLSGEKIRMLVMDSDGAITLDFNNLKDKMAPGCVLVIDDYIEANDKSDRKIALVTASVDALVEAGTLIPFCVTGWGTWFGRLA